MKLVLLCAGQGTRMLPLTKILPKEMFPLGSKPLLHHTILNFFEAGIRDYFFVLGSGKESIIEYFSYCESSINELKELNDLIKNTNIHFLNDTYKGTGGSLISSKEYIDGNYFFLIFGDMYISPQDIENMLSLHQNKNQVALLIDVDVSYKDKYKQTILGEKNYILDMLADPNIDNNNMNIVGGAFILHKDIFESISKSIDFSNKEKEFGLIRPLQNMLWKHKIIGYQGLKTYDLGNIAERKKIFNYFE